MINKPLVSCVMPTWNRREFIPGAIDCFLKQTHENRELIILDDGEEAIEDLIPKDNRIHYVFENKRRCTGDKRNRVCEIANGKIICHWDDDDWSAADRIAFQLDILNCSQKSVTGFAIMLFWDSLNQCVRRYKATMKGYVCGSSLFYTKQFWQIHRFRNRQQASDNDFMSPILNQIAYSNDSNHMVARIHNCHHTSRKNGIKEIVSPKLIPQAFWENEKLRLC